MSVSGFNAHEIYDAMREIPLHNEQLHNDRRGVRITPCLHLNGIQEFESDLREMKNARSVSQTKLSIPQYRARKYQYLSIDVPIL